MALAVKHPPRPANEPVRDYEPGVLHRADRGPLRPSALAPHAGGDLRNFYGNDKPTAAVVGQQPFGGGRRSGTNDKAGSFRTCSGGRRKDAIKETFVPPTDYRYPHMAEA